MKVSRRKFQECQILLKGQGNRTLHCWPGRDTHLLDNLMERINFRLAAGGWADWPCRPRE